MLKEIIISVQSYFEAHWFVKTHKLWKWILIPGVIYALLFAVSMFLFGESASDFIEWVFTVTHIKEWMQLHQGGILNFIFAFATFVLWIILMLFYFSLFKYIWLIVGSPVFAYLSEKTEVLMQNKTYSVSTKQLLKDIGRGIYISVRSSLWQTVYLVSLFILSFIPVIGWATPVIALLVEGYYYGFSMLDYSFERRKLSAQQSIYFIGHHRGLAIGNGIVFYSMHLVPIIGWILAPAYAVIAATLSIIKVMDTEKTINNKPTGIN